MNKLKIKPRKTNLLAGWFMVMGVSLLLFSPTLFAFEPLFDTWISYDVGETPYSVFASDLDGDGDFDLVTANASLGINTVSILKNNGNGTFAAKVDYGTGSRPFSVIASDLDGDGDKYLVTANIGNYITTSTVSVLKNNGDGTFAPKINYGAGYAPI